MFSLSDTRLKFVYLTMTYYELSDRLGYQNYERIVGRCGRGYGALCLGLFPRRRAEHLLQVLAASPIGHQFNLRWLWMYGSLNLRACMDNIASRSLTPEQYCCHPILVASVLLGRINV